VTVAASVDTQPAALRLHEPEIRLISATCLARDELVDHPWAGRAAIQVSTALHYCSRGAAKSFDPDLQPWERQPEEPDEAYQMFLTYWDMTTRNMALFDAEQYAARE
jgi:hypothetical protein